MHYLLSFLVCDHRDEEKRAGCFALIAFLMSFDWWRSVALSQYAVGLSAVFACGISWSYYIFQWNIQNNEFLHLDQHYMQVIIVL